MVTLPSEKRGALVYASCGKTLHWSRIDAAAGVLRWQGSAEASAPVQFGVADHAGRFLYLATSDGGPNGKLGTSHALTVWRIGADGAPLPTGMSMTLPSRPIHLCLDPLGEYLLATFYHPAALQVYRIGVGGALEGPLAQSEVLDYGVFPHQTRILPGTDIALVCARGNDARQERAEECGALLSLHFVRGQLTQLARLDLPAGLGARNCDWHPDGHWAYVVFERGNQLGFFHLHGGALRAPAVALFGTLAGTAPPCTSQRAGAVLVHPNGRVLYVINRADRTVQRDGVAVLAGGENNIAVFALDPLTGLPSLLQHVDTRGVEARTFCIDAENDMLIVGNQKSSQMRVGEIVSCLPSGLALFRILDDGRLQWLSKQNSVIDDDVMWTALVPGRHNA